MARKVKCKITGEWGTNETFVKIDGHYYKSREIYDEYKENKAYQKLIVKIIFQDFLNHEEGQAVPSYLFKKLKELDVYPTQVIYNTVIRNKSSINYYMNSKEFVNDSARINYIFAIIKNNINDEYKRFKAKKKKEIDKRKEVVVLQENELISSGTVSSNLAKRGTDISGFL